MTRIAFIVIVSAMILSSSAFSRSGIGYYFKEKRVMKKFYHGSLTHTQNEISDRIYKSEKLLFKTDEFKIIPSGLTGIKEQTQFFIDNLVVRSQHSRPVRQKVFHLKASFKVPHFMFVDLRPKKEILLPSWAKSLDFWVLPTDKSLKVSLYFIYPNGLKMRYNFPLNRPFKWRKVYINLIHGSTKKLYKDQPIKLTKIRLSKSSQNNPTTFSLITTAFEVYNYQKNNQNLHLDPYKTFADFEKGHPKHWSYTVDNVKISEKMAQITPHEGGPLLWERNKKSLYLLLSVPESIHQQKNVFIYFPVGFYKLAKGHQISLWVKGEGKGEQVSVIFQEGKWRYFELVLGEVHFVGWKKLTAMIPKEKIVYFKDDLSDQNYILLIGLKISGASSGEPIRLGFDQIEGVIEPGRLGNIRDL